MPAKPLTFAADVDAWVRQTDQRMREVFRASAQDVVKVMQTVASEGGAMPVDSGFLRASLLASNSEMPKAIVPNPDPKRKYPYNPRPINLVILGTELGQELYTGYTAVYAPHLEFGTRNLAARAFVRLAAAQWQQIVNRNVVKAKNAALGGFSTLT